MEIWHWNDTHAHAYAHTRSTLNPPKGLPVGLTGMDRTRERGLDGWVRMGHDKGPELAKEEILLAGPTESPLSLVWQPMVWSLSKILGCSHLRAGSTR